MPQGAAHTPEDTSPLKSRRAKRYTRKLKKKSQTTIASEGGLGQTQAESTSAWRTMAQTTKHVPTVAGRLIVCSLLAVLVAASLLIVVAFYVNQAQYRAYTVSNVELLSRSIADTLSLSYQDQHAWTPSSIKESKAIFDHNDTLDLCVTNEAGIIIYNDFDRDINPNAATSSDNTIVQKTDIVLNNRVIGHVILSQKIPGTTPDDLTKMLSGELGILLWGTLIASVAFAVLIALLMAHWIAVPLRRITRTIQQLRLGNYRARTGLVGRDELGQLGETLDTMASALERNSDTEHKLTSDIAHELRTPLMAIQVNIEGMQDGVLPADPEHLETVASEIRRLSRLVDAMLTLSRLENNTALLHKDYLSIGPLVRDIMETQLPLFQSQNRKLEFVQEASDAQLMAMIDADMLTRAILNLLSNALRYTEEEKEVRLTIGRASDEIFIEVADEGIGISEEDIEHVFSRFWRSDAGRARVSGGLGVGLSLVDEIASKHSGYVQVESQEGKGSVFTIYLPAA